MKNIFTFLIAGFSLLSYSQTVGLQLFKDGFLNVTDVAGAPGDGRLFVVEQGGRIRILNPNQTINATNFLTIPPGSIRLGIETGLLGMAFHPNYATNGYFYVCYISPSGNTIIARYAVSSNPNIANPTGTIVMSIPLAASEIHRGGSLHFGNDGYLYVSLGDNAEPNTAQDVTKYQGKILRINVNSSTPTTPNYSVPADNPYVGIDGIDEIWAIGFRNPWKFSFNRLNGDMWIADVGEGTEEEINKASPTASGLNYGWNCYEGNSPNNLACTPVQFTFPVASYSNSGNFCAIVGGFAYTGSLYPAFSGKYLFSDFCANQIGYINESGGAITWSASFAPDDSIVCFAEDRNGELFVGTYYGAIYKLVDTSLATTGFKKPNLKLYPNPATTEVYLNADINFPANVMVTDLTGKQLLKQSISSEADAISTASLQNGVYIVSIKDNAGTGFTSKLTKH